MSQNTVSRDVPLRRRGVTESTNLSDTPRSYWGELDWGRYFSYLIFHALSFGAFWTGVSAIALVVAAITFFGRVFVLTAFFHRYFSHRTFKTSRTVQLIAAWIGSSSIQRGPIWWASHHRRHHLHSDTGQDSHSPHAQGFWYAHMGWFMTPDNISTDRSVVKDWLKFPELVWLEKWHFVPPMFLAAAMYGLGAACERMMPQLGTNGPQMFIWAFIISTNALYHTTYAVNSIAHTVGTRRFKTDDHSRNNFLLALLTFGEGWHNNHHHYPHSARQGFYWWEIDISYYILRMMAMLGIVWEIKEVPAAILESGNPLPNRGSTP